jgi:hypothetical protein
MDNQANQVHVQIGFTKSQVASSISMIDKHIVTLNEMINTLSGPVSSPEQAILHSILGRKTKTGEKIVGYIENEISNLKQIKIKFLQADLDLEKQTKEAAQS